MKTTTKLLLTLSIATAGGCAEKDRYVLVHGAWMGAWAWDEVATQLTEEGNEAVIVELPGHGADTTPIRELSLADYTAKVVTALDASETQNILVAHSMGGIVISEAAEARPEKIKELIYLAAYRPTHGKSLLDLAFTDTQSLLTVEGNLIFAPDQSSAAVNPAILIEAFCADCDEAEAQQLKTNTQAEPTAPLATPSKLSNENFGSVPCRYIHTKEDRAVGYELQLRMVATSSCTGTAKIIDASHSPLLSKPDQVVDALLP